MRVCYSLSGRNTNCKEDKIGCCLLYSFDIDDFAQYRKRISSSKSSLFRMKFQKKNYWRAMS